MGRGARDDVLARSVFGAVVVHLVALIVLATAPRDVAAERDDDDERVAWMRRLLHASAMHHDRAERPDDPPCDTGDTGATPTPTPTHAPTPTAAPTPTLALTPAHAYANTTRASDTPNDSQRDTDLRLATMFASVVGASTRVGSPELWSAPSDAPTTSRFYGAPLGPAAKPSLPSLGLSPARALDCVCSATTAHRPAASATAVGPAAPPSATSTSPRARAPATPPAPPPTSSSRADVAVEPPFANERGPRKRWLRGGRGGGGRACPCD